VRVTDPALRCVDVEIGWHHSPAQAEWNCFSECVNQASYTSKAFQTPQRETKLGLRYLARRPVAQ
jgi:hypothetical protein